MMLASRGTVADIARLQKAGYLFDLKIDGVRCQASVKDGEVTLISRQGVACTGQYPEIVEELARLLPKGEWLLDGELAVNDERGLPSWPLTLKRNAQTRNTSGWAAKLPATFYLFDLLVQDGQDIRRWSLANRRQVLGQTFPDPKGRAQVVLHSYDGEALWSVVVTYGLEGMVAKRPAGGYREGRTSDWVKIKRTHTVTCLVDGMDAGEGSRESTFGNLHLHLLKGDARVPVGKVGSGFSDRELVEVMQALHHPPTIVEVKYLDVSPDGQLRQPVFLRLRKDADLSDCTYDQLAYQEAT